MACRSQPCPYPNLVMPSGRKSPLCSWHRLLRTSTDAQIREAERRLAASSGPHHARIPARDWPADERFCSGCQSMIPLFYTTGSRCKACASKAARDSHRKAAHGLTPEDWKRILEIQDGRCAICRNRQVSKSLAADHDHQTEVRRGALCSRCNHDLLGAAFESVRVLLAAASYLLAPPTSGDWIDPEIGGDRLLAIFTEAVHTA